jgi:hypothetical protein
MVRGHDRSFIGESGLLRQLSLDPWTNVAGDRRVNEGSAP